MPVVQPKKAPTANNNPVKATNKAVVLTVFNFASPHISTLGTDFHLFLNSFEPIFTMILNFSLQNWVVKTRNHG